MPSLFALAISLKHKFQSAKADGTDSTEVRPSNWNDEHDLILPDAGVVGKEDAGSGPAKLIPFSSLNIIPAGMLFPYAGSIEPAGYLFPYGQVLERIDQPALFAAIGTSYNTGGETAAQFRLPDMRDVVPAGRGNMGGTARGLLDNSTGLGGLMGAKSVTLTADQQATMPLTGTTGVNATFVPYGPTVFNGPGVGGDIPVYNGPSAISGSATGGGQGHPNVQPTTIVNWLIKT
jgi:microcystin-dependent protein